MYSCLSSHMFARGSSADFRKPTLPGPDGPGPDPASPAAFLLNMSPSLAPSPGLPIPC